MTPPPPEPKRIRNAWGGSILADFFRIFWVLVSRTRITHRYTRITHTHTHVYARMPRRTHAIPHMCMYARTPGVHVYARTYAYAIKLGGMYTNDDMLNYPPPTKTLQ